MAHKITVMMRFAKGELTNRLQCIPSPVLACSLRKRSKACEHALERFRAAPSLDAAHRLYGSADRLHVVFDLAPAVTGENYGSPFESEVDGHAGLAGVSAGR